MFRKTTIIKGLIILLVGGVIVSLGWTAWWKFGEKKTEEYPTTKEEETTKEKYRTEPLPPLDVDLQLKKEHFSLGDTVDIEVKITPKRDVKEAKVKCLIWHPYPEEASSTLTLIGKDRFELGNLKKNTPYYLTTQIKISDIGKARFTCGVNVITLQGYSFGNSDSLFFIVSQQEVLVGKGGFIPVKLENLERKRINKLITEEEYRKQIHELLKGRAIETYRIITPDEKSKSR